jgi:electron transfer flavoprotein beta subunit
VLATAYALSQAAQSIGNFDLLLCGKQTTDGDTAQVGAEMAEFLNIAHAGNVLSVLEADKSSVTVKVNLESHIATQKITLPCLLCMDGEINTPRLPSYKRKKSMQCDPVTVIGLDRLDDQDEKRYGIAGSPTQVERIFPPQKSNVKETLCGTSKEMAGRLVQILHSRKFF